ncbi:hypothetical protein PIB30_048998 [Stylosanthes scabra]|uniref:Uncharacterized protein n=1 Tax=Stylosanthes scabra TaxID=79078 RepID=A0ABU6YFH4_9FABA|nr:hypothetical protein [Stylosanthes scabra]
MGTLTVFECKLFLKLLAYYGVKLYGDCQLSNCTWPGPLDTYVVRMYLASPLDMFAECTHFWKPYLVLVPSNIRLQVVNRRMSSWLAQGQIYIVIVRNIILVSCALLMFPVEEFLIAGTLLRTLGSHPLVIFPAQEITFEVMLSIGRGFVLPHKKGESIEDNSGAEANAILRMPMIVKFLGVKYGCFDIEADEDLQVLFHCKRQFPEVRTTEPFAEIVDPLVSSGGSALNPHSANVVGSSCPVIQHDTEDHQVASPTSRFNLQEEAVDCGERVPEPLVDEALRLDDSDDEPAFIKRDNDDDIGPVLP